MKCVFIYLGHNIKGVGEETMKEDRDRQGLVLLILMVFIAAVWIATSRFVVAVAAGTGYLLITDIADEVTNKIVKAIKDSK